MLLRVNHHRLRFDLLGTGNRTICFAHALAADSGMWAEQVPALLARGFRVLTIDMRGHGGSDSVAGDYTLKELAGDVAGVLAAMEFEKVDFVGLSIGGMIGEALAIHFKERVASLFLCESPPASLKNAREIWTPRMASALAAKSLEPIADATMARWLTEEFRARNPVRWRQIRETVASTSVAGYCGCIAALSNFDFTCDLPKLAVPALVLCGEDDKASSLEENRKLAELIPGGRFVAFAGARHLPNVEAPKRFNRILLEWLDGTST
jgi:3-oxoadipate enol-lactonase